MLGWLLDPKGWHGLQHHFAQAFVRTIRHRSGTDDVAAPVVVTEIHREFSTGFGPVDLLLRGYEGEAPFVLAIENKIDSPEGKDQLE